MIKNNVEYLYTAENTVNVAICHSKTESQNKKKQAFDRSFHTKNLHWTLKSIKLCPWSFEIIGEKM